MNIGQRRENVVLDAALVDAAQDLEVSAFAPPTTPGVGSELKEVNFVGNLFEKFKKLQLTQYLVVWNPKRSSPHPIKRTEWKPFLFSAPNLE